MPAETIQAVASTPTNPGVYIFLGAVIAALVGLLSNWLNNWLNKKEKFKEILYKEKFEAYKNISTALYKASVEYFKLSEGNVIRRERISPAICIAEDFYSEFMRYSDVISKKSFSTIFPILKAIQENQPIEKLYDIAKEYKNTVREDLHVEAIDKAIGATFPFFSLQNIPDKKDDKK